MVIVVEVGDSEIFEGDTGDVAIGDNFVEGEVTKLTRKLLIHKSQIMCDSSQKSDLPGRGTA